MNHREIHLRITSALQRHPLAAAILFGSYAKESVHPESDVDIAILPDVDDSNDHDTLLAAATTDVAQALRVSDRKVDLSVLTELPLPLRFTVLNRGRKLFVRNEELLRNELLRTAALYHDQQPHIKAANERFAKSLQ